MNKIYVEKRGIPGKHCHVVRSTARRWGLVPAPWAKGGKTREKGGRIPPSPMVLHFLPSVMNNGRNCLNFGGENEIKTIRGCFTC